MLTSDPTMFRPEPLDAVEVAYSIHRGDTHALVARGTIECDPALPSDIGDAIDCVRDDATAIADQLGTPVDWKTSTRYNRRYVASTTGSARHDRMTHPFETVALPSTHR